MRNNKYSDLKIVAFPEKLQSFREGRITAPVYVRVKPLNRCNHGCRWCVYKADRRDSDDAMDVIHSQMHTDMKESDTLPRDKFLEVLKDFREMGVKAVTYSGGGEPLLYPDIDKFMTHTSLLGLDLSIITNGQLLSGDRAKALTYAKWVRVSMDYTTGAQMAHSRAVPERLFDQVLENIANFAKIKGPLCDLGVNYIVHRDNCEGLVDFAMKLFALGVENIRFSPMYCPELIAYHKPIHEKVEAQLREIQCKLDEQGDAHKSVNSTYNIFSPSHAPERTYTRCFFMQTVPVIGADQKVYACHNKAYDNTGCIGSIANKSFRDLWFSPEAKQFFEKLNPKHDCCHQCANDMKNRHIMNLVDASFDNFV